MPRMTLDHLYRETRHWEESVAWWGNLGFTFAERWGGEPHRAGRLECGGAVVVLAEVPATAEPASSVFLASDDIADLSMRTGAPVIETHWGTTMVSLTDPDGHIYHFEPGGA
jgi:hypothetical protein